MTRLRAKAIYRVQERKALDKASGITSDQVMALSSAHAIKRGAPKLRRV